MDDTERFREALKKIYAQPGGDWACEDMRDIAEDALFPGSPNNRSEIRKRTSLWVQATAELQPGQRLFYSQRAQPVPEAMFGARVTVIGPPASRLSAFGIEKVPGVVRVRVDHLINGKQLTVGGEILAHVDTLYVETDLGWLPVVGEKTT